MASDQQEEIKTRRRWSWLLGAALLVSALGAGILWGATGGKAAQASPQSDQPPQSTTEVARGTLTGSKRMPGTLDYTAPKQLRSSAAGTITWLPKGGDVIGNGGTLYALDNVNRYLMHGAMPAWRGFAAGMDPGPDVEQLEKALAQMGYFEGEAGPYFNWATQESIRRWQKATGQKVTGEIEPGLVTFLPSDVRVAAVESDLGAQASPETALLKLSGQQKEVTVNVKLGDQQLAQVGGEVSAELPGGQKIKGTIREVGQAQEDPNQKDAITIPVAISLDDQTPVAKLQRLSVSVDFPSEVREDVLYVPLEALLALPGDQMGVEVFEDGQARKVPVNVGLIAAGLAEISGEGIKEGTKVVVPS